MQRVQEIISSTVPIVIVAHRAVVFNWKERVDALNSFVPDGLHAGSFYAGLPTKLIL